MNLQKKVENHPQKQESKPVVSYNRSAYEVNTQVIIPVGKHSGKTLQWIIDNDKSYYSWIQKENLIDKWNLQKLRNIQVKTNKPRWDQMYSETYNRVLVGIRICSVDIPEEQYNQQLPY